VPNSKRRGPGVHQGGPRTILKKKRNYGAQVNPNRNKKVGSLILYCPPSWPGHLGRPPDDAVSKAGAGSGPLGSKASGGTMRGKAGLGSPGRHSPDLNATPPRSEAAGENEGGGRGWRGGQAQWLEQRGERPQGPAGVCDPSGPPGYNL